LILGIGIALLGNAPFWPTAIVYTLFTLLHLKSFGHLTRLKENWRDFEVILETDRVAVRRHGSLESSISRSEISRVVEMPGHGLWIHTPDIRQRIFVPSLITGYEELRSTLAEWSTIRRMRSRLWWQYIGMPAALAIYASALLVRSPFVFLPLLAFAGFYLLRLASLSIRVWRKHGWHWRRSIDPHGFVQDAFWVPAIPFMMLALLLTKLAWIIR
jgi:hypothetical protein